VGPPRRRTLEFDDAERKAGMTAAEETQTASVDGRTARALRTREAIVDACISLVDEGVLKPTAPRIAERAGVSVRSVFQHFDDLESLFAMVAERVVGRLASILSPIDPGLPLDERVERFASERRALLEAMTPIRRAAAVHAPFSPEIRSRLQAGHDFLRTELMRVFAPELSATTGLEREDLLDVLDVSASWSTWETLRTLNGRSPDACEALVARMLRTALVGIEAPSPAR
jgi:TetR/AcrR family transcriptional regulator, regulator of autoinduction and epiphytic fitness